MKYTISKLEALKLELKELEEMKYHYNYSYRRTEKMIDDEIQKVKQEIKECVKNEQ